jgi:Trk K+ transport system NAD-binding subunit
MTDKKLTERYEVCIPKDSKLVGIKIEDLEIKVSHIHPNGFLSKMSRVNPKSDYILQPGDYINFDYPKIKIYSFCNRYNLKLIK